MAFTRADIMATAERSPSAAGERDRSTWVGLFTEDGRVEDPVGSTPHRGRSAIGRFYDTFIGPRDIRFHPDVDIVVGQTVVRDGELEVTMAATLTLRVPVYIRYDLEDVGGELRISALAAFWELPAMVLQFLRGGVRAIPAGLQLSRLLIRNQGLVGTLGFLGGFRGVGSGAKGVVTRFLDSACAGDEIGMRRKLAGRIRISSGDDLPLSAADLSRHLSGARWRKLIGSGHAVVAATERAGQRSVVFAEVGSEPAVITRIRVFSEAG
ncbi:MAG: nuclear transport factor 2 family protein [Mycobacterium sp.]